MKHSTLEKSILLLSIMVLIVASIGSMVEIIPLFIKEVSVERVDGARPHSPLELLGFNIYKREGCYSCHSQQIRVLDFDVSRYGHYSLSAESMYDYPAQWGSKRTGPDLARIGGKYSNEWHVRHLRKPQEVVIQSVMPSYKFLEHRALDYSTVQKQMKIYQSIGVDYSDKDIAEYERDIKIQLGYEKDAKAIENFNQRYPNAAIGKFNEQSKDITEMDALISYLQALGKKVAIETNRGIKW